MPTMLFVRTLKFLFSDSKMANHRLLLVVIFIVSLSSAAANLLQICEKPQFCPSSTIPIKYPFHLPQIGNEFYCGYDGFEVACDGVNPVMNILNDELHLASVSYDDKSFIVVDTDVAEDECPEVGHSLNVSMLKPSFDFPSNQNAFLGFFVNCSTDNFLDFPSPNNTINCYGSSSGGRESYVIELPSEDRDKSFSWKGICEDYFIMPVRKRDDDTFPNIGKNFSSILKEGFVLKWKVSPASFCAQCEISSGLCAHNRTTQQSLCICRNDVVAVNGTCNPTTEKSFTSTRKKAIIAIVSTLGFILLAVVSGIIFARYHKRNKVLPSLESQSISKKKRESVKASKYLGVHIFSYAELEEATNQFDESREIGDGGFGAVYYGKLRDGRIVAVKRLYETHYRREQQFMNEVEILARVNHRNLVTLHGCTSHNSRDLLLVYEFVENGTVSEHLNGKKTFLGWEVRMRIAVETAGALSYLHASEIIHRDVKTSNILLDKNFRVKVADFGLSKIFPLNATHVSTAPQGTPGYVDPEYHKSYQLTEKSDVYSFGVVLAELISSLAAVDITRPVNDINLFNMAIDRIGNKKLRELVDPALRLEADTTVEGMVTAVAELAFRCLKEEKGERPSMDEVHESLKKIQAMDGKVHCEDDDDSQFIGVPLSPVSVVTTWSSRDSTPNFSC